MGRPQTTNGTAPQRQTLAYAFCNHFIAAAGSWTRATACVPFSRGASELLAPCASKRPTSSLAPILARQSVEFVAHSIFLTWCTVGALCGGVKSSFDVFWTLRGYRGSARTACYACVKTPCHSITVRITQVCVILWSVGMPVISTAASSEPSNSIGRFVSQAPGSLSVRMRPGTPSLHTCTIRICVGRAVNDLFEGHAV